MSKRRLKTFAKVIAGQSPASDDVHPLENGTPFIQGNAEFGHLYPTPIWESSTAPKRAQKGDILISVRAPIGAVNIATGVIGLGRGVAAVRAADTSVQDWLYWALIASNGELQSKGAGSTFAAIAADDLKTLEFSIPAQPAIIADYLEREAVEIDELIAELELLNTLRRERWNSQLLQTFASLKHEAPSRKIGWDFRVGNGSTPKSDRGDYWDGGSTPWMNSSVVNHWTACEPSRLVTDTAIKECHLPLVPSGSVLVGLTGQGKTRGMATVLEIDSTINQHLAYITPLGRNSPVPTFVRYALTAAYDDLRLVSDAGGSTKGALTCASLKQFHIPAPSRALQESIVLKLESDRKANEEASRLVDRAITLAKERRAALITAAVTGQIDVTAKRRPVAEQLEDDIKELS